MREQAPYQFNPEVLREYDIRGEIGKTLSSDDAFALGCAFGTYVVRLKGSKVAVGYDGRHTSPELCEALIAGLITTGIHVENIGVGPTPMLYYAVKDRMMDAGIMITGSHNPPSYNGFKMTLNSRPIFGDDIQDIGKLSASGDFEKGEGSQRTIDLQDSYVDRLLKDLECKNSICDKLKIAWDCGNGATGDIVTQLTSRIPGEHILLYNEVDGDFPNHHPDPSVDKNMQDLIDTVINEKCHLGIAFDGDGDRIGVVDENGTIIRSDILLSLYAKEVLEDYPGAPIIADVKCSQVLFDEIKRLGGEPVMWKTGHSLVKDKMQKIRSPLGGEFSGHIFFADKWYGFDDGTYCAIRLINILAEADAPLSSLFTHIPTTYATKELRFDVEEAEKFDIITRLLSDLESDKSEEDEGVQITDMDGIRVMVPEGWWLLRASNTQSSLVTRAEGVSNDALEKIKQMVYTQVAKAGYNISFDEE
jgi:phosphomannomutase